MTGSMSMHSSFQLGLPVAVLRQRVVMIQASHPTRATYASRPSVTATHRRAKQDRKLQRQRPSVHQVTIKTMHSSFLGSVSIRIINACFVPLFVQKLTIAFSFVVVTMTFLSNFASMQVLSRLLCFSHFLHNSWLSDDFMKTTSTFST